MIVAERLQLIDEMCRKLVGTSSRTEKEYIVEQYRGLDVQLSKDITYVFEILSGMHKLGYTFTYCNGRHNDNPRMFHDISLQEFIAPLYSIEYKGEVEINQMCMQYVNVYHYLAPILNRDWRLGINKSQVAKTIISPMLAKKYEPGKHCTNANEEYYITEKLDGNRCIAVYNFSIEKWEFYSRSGKLLKVNFDMLYMPKGLVYDGEILSLQQIHNPSQSNFNDLSGKVNSNNAMDKLQLVYMIFDIVDDTACYVDRRKALNNINAGRIEYNSISNVNILPIINCLKADQMPKLGVLLEMIESKGGEGLMINLGSRKYEHKRTDGLLKVKSTYTMDMEVVGLEYGTGKYEDAVGALCCRACDNNIIYYCKVGSGLSDDERFTWANNPKMIMGKIVEVAYFSLSQDKNSQGTSTYSLRFPRFRKIRTDKTTTSVD